MNNKGFTLVELLIVIVLLSLVIAITIPSLSLYYEENQKEMYNEYEKMMVEYAKEMSLSKEIILLNEMDGLETIKRQCDGYVKKENNKYQAYINCQNKYHTNGYEKRT